MLQLRQFELVFNSKTARCFEPLPEKVVVSINDP
jgi:hypothetical protein